MIRLATVTDFRDSLAYNLKRLQQQAADGRHKPEQVRAGLREYRMCFGIIDAMTASERNEPFATITGSRLHRIAKGAGTDDQAVIRLLMSLSQFQELKARAEFTGVAQSQ
jgi:signal recognition particle GTPase